MVNKKLYRERDGEKSAEQGQSGGMGCYERESEGRGWEVVDILTIVACSKEGFLCLLSWNLVLSMSRGWTAIASAKPEAAPASMMARG